MSSSGSLRSVRDKVLGLDRNGKLIVLLIVTIAVYGSGIAFDTFVLSSDLLPDFSHVDVPRYQERAQAIIDGKLLYRDVHTETPVLINIILVPAQLMGGGADVYVWSAYFSVFAFLLGAMMYLSFRKADENKAFILGLFVLLCPFLLGETVIAEDESIMSLLFIMAAVLMFYNRKGWSAVTIGVGIWTKMFPVLLLPVEFLRQRASKDKAVLLIIVLAITAMATIPFLILCPDEFVEFMRFYLLGDPERHTGGQSVWHFLDQGGFVLPRLVMLGIIVGGLAFAYFYAYRKRWGIWESMTIAVLAFFIFYPKIHTGYYTILFALLAVWAVENKQIAIRIVVAWVPVLASALFAKLEDGRTFIDDPNGWIFGLLLSLAAMLLFIDATRIALKTRPFIYKGLKESGDMNRGPGV